MKQNRFKFDYVKLLGSGMFFEFHPELSGNWDDDKAYWCRLQRIKQTIQLMKDQRIKENGT